MQRKSEKMIKNKDFFEKMNELHSFDVDMYLKSLQENPKKSIRINNIKVNGNIISHLPFNVVQNRVNQDLYYVDSEDKVGNTIEHHCGAFYVQEPAASMPVFAIKDSLPGAIVVDLCASPGGKTTQLAEYVGAEGLIISNEIVAKRVNVLRGNIERLGISNAVVTNNNVEQLADILAGVADVVVVDAPCSGEGMFRKDPDTVMEWSEGGVEACASRQLYLLQNASRMLKNDGIMIYSTCTFNRNENEMVVEQFLNTNPDFVVCDVPEAIKSVSRDGEAANNKIDLKKCRRFYPQDDFGEGQFLCVMHKNGKGMALLSKNTKNKQMLLTKSETDIVMKFLQENFTISNCMLGKVGGQIFLMPQNMLDVSGLNIVACGVCVGEIRNGRLEPHHHLYMALGQFSRNKLDIQDERLAKKFIAGEQLNNQAVADGYCAVLYNGITLGFGKSKGGVINNRYPKGLRKILQ